MLVLAPPRLVHLLQFVATNSLYFMTKEMSRVSVTQHLQTVTKKPRQRDFIQVTPDIRNLSEKWTKNYAMTSVKC